VVLVPLTKPVEVVVWTYPVMEIIERTTEPLTYPRDVDTEVVKVKLAVVEVGAEVGVGVAVEGTTTMVELFVVIVVARVNPAEVLVAGADNLDVTKLLSCVPARVEDEKTTVAGARLGHNL
jgi:hypothetical protein